MIQMKEVIELLEPRYKVVALWPNTDFQLGQIITNLGASAIRHYNEFPHLFKPLQWWEERKESEMPEYVKESEGTEFGSIIYVHKVIEHFTHGGACCLSDGNINYVYLQPATKEEYDLYTQSKCIGYE